MKIILEDADTEEVSITIRGNIADEKVQNIINLLKSSSISSKIIVYTGDKEILINISEIEYFTVLDRRVFAFSNKNKYECRYSLSELVSLFKNQGIVQIGKSLLVNINFVKSLEAEFSGNYYVTMNDNTRLIASRFYMKEFRKAIMEV